MSHTLGAFPGFGVPYTTASAGTAFVALVPGHKDHKIKLHKVSYTSGATAHSLTFMRPLSKVLLSSAAAKGATSIVLAEDPGAWGSAKTVAANNIASGDWIAYRQGDGTWAYNKLTGSPTTDANGLVTCAVSALGAALAAGTEIFFFGVPADSDPNTGSAHPKYVPPVSMTYTWDGNGAALLSTLGVGEPMLIHSDNATAQGYLEFAAITYGV